jgi:hypothetical protein
LVPPKPKLFGQRARIGIGLGLVRHEVDRRLHRGIVEVDGGGAIWSRIARQVKAASTAPAGAQQVPDGRLGRAHRRLARRIAQQAAHRAQLQLVAPAASRCRGR